MKARLGQLIRYSGTAGVAAVVDLGGFALLEWTGIGIAVAAAASFLVATVANYLLTSRLVFAHRATLRGYRRFLVAAVAGFLVNVGVTVLADQVFDLTPITAKATGIGFAFFVNFALNVVFVFGVVKAPGKQDDTPQ